MKKKILLPVIIFCCIAATTNAQWQLNGNATTAGNFLGTTNAKPLKFKANNQNSGLIDYDGTKSNTGFGYQTLLANTTGKSNTAIGYQALVANTTGYYNTACGYIALSKNTTGSLNTATGWAALSSNTTGYDNTATGYGTLLYNSTGHENTATGLTALFFNTTGSFNTGTGVGALTSNTTGDNNIATGFNTLYSNTTGYDNTAIGKNALYSNTSGTENTATGSGSLQNNATGIWNTAAGKNAMFANTTGNQGTAIGFAALFSNTTGQGSTANGFKALTSNTTGGSNTALGNNSLVNNTTGSFNVGIGQSAMQSNTTEDFNTAIGYGANVQAGSYSSTALGAAASANGTNSTAVGNGASTTAQDQVMLGNTSITSVKAAGSYVIYSDGRFKKNIKENVPGLEFINELKPVTYNYDIHKLNDYIRPVKKESSENIQQSKSDKVQEDAIVKKEKIVYTGFIAQEVEKAADKTGYNFSGVYKPQNDKDPYGLSYADFVVPLVKAVQELSKENDELKARLDKIEQMKATANSASASSTSIELSDAVLDQNVPNPLSNSTTIHYKIPSGGKKAELIIKDMGGRVIQQMVLNTSTNGAVNINASSLSSGTYNYSLIVDGRNIGSKKMVVAK